MLLDNNMVTVFDQIDVITHSQREYACESSVLSVANGDLWRGGMYDSKQLSVFSQVCCDQKEGNHVYPNTATFYANAVTVSSGGGNPDWVAKKCKV